MNSKARKNRTARECSFKNPTKGHNNICLTSGYGELSLIHVVPISDNLTTSKCSVINQNIKLTSNGKCCRYPGVGKSISQTFKWIDRFSEELKNKLLVVEVSVLHGILWQKKKTIWNRTFLTAVKARVEKKANKRLWL